MTSNVTSNSTYVISNVKSGTVIDLSLGDNRTITGWTPNGGANQKWTLYWTGNSWTFKSNYTGTYLAINGSPGDGTSLVASTTPFQWDIWRDPNNENTFRIYVPNTYENLDLWADGDPTPGDPITLWTAWDGLHQTWNFTKV